MFLRSVCLRCVEDVVGALDHIVEASLDEVVRLVQRDRARERIPQLQQMRDLVLVAGGPHCAPHSVAFLKELLDKLRGDIAARAQAACYAVAA